MPEKVTFPDCCEQPELVTVKSLRKTTHDVESICRCTKCGRHWYHRMHERLTRGSDYDRRIWCASLTDEEAVRLLACPGQVDVSFLWDKPGILQDEEGQRHLPKKPPLSSG